MPYATSAAGLFNRLLGTNLLSHRFQKSFFCCASMGVVLPGLSPWHAANYRSTLAQ